MEIDLFTLGAQIVNFLILIYLLQRFLYGPIINAMDRREEKITNRLQSAEEKRQQAEEEMKEYRNKRIELEEQRDDLLAEAREEADQRKKELLDEVRHEVERTRENWQSSLKRERDRFVKELRRNIYRQTNQIARQALSDLADQSLEHQMTKSFIKQLENLNEDEKLDFKKALEEADHHVTVRSVYEISDDSWHELINTIQSQFPIEEKVIASYERNPDLLCGIEIQANGRRLAWAIEDYLETLENRVIEFELESIH